ncbi:hypothetical protein F5I97DRAFT_293 [Phlebopus sp. FC_14]|nr:hypothetical protein F5I97DRAFT_293 [Phlebopus sp. FC_14]
MSSSSNYHPSQLHHVNLHPNGKRPFEECGYDSDSDSHLNTGLQPSGSGSSARSSRFSSSPSSSTSSGEGRNKRARSNSTSSHSSSSDASRSTGYDTARSSAHSDLSLDGPSASPRAADCPVRPSTAFVSQEEPQDILDLVVDRPRQVSPPPRAPPSASAEQQLRASLERLNDEFDRQQEMSNLIVDRRHQVSPSRVPLSTAAEQQLRASLERFNEFDRQMAALRTSLAASRSSSVLPPMASSAGEDTQSPRDNWTPMSSSFLSMSSNGRLASGSSDAVSANATVAPSETLRSSSTFGSSDGSSAGTGPASTSSDGGVSFATMYGNFPRYPPYSPYRPTSGVSSSAALDRARDSTLPVEEPPPYSATSRSGGVPQLASRSSDSLATWSPPPGPRLGPIRRSPSPLVLNPEARSVTTVDNSLASRYRAVAESSRSPRGWLGRNGPDGGVSRGSSFQPWTLVQSPRRALDPVILCSGFTDSIL